MTADLLSSEKRAPEARVENAAHFSESPYLVLAMGEDAERPVNPIPGTLFYNVQVSSLQIFDGVSWLDI